MKTRLHLAMRVLAILRASCGPSGGSRGALSDSRSWRGSRSLWGRSSSRARGCRRGLVALEICEEPVVGEELRLRLPAWRWQPLSV